MVPSTFHFPVFLIFMCGFALLSAIDGAKIKDKTLTMAKVCRELRRESGDSYDYHVLSMLIITAYNDRLYNITDETLSPECLKTVKVAVTMKLQLTMGQEIDSVLNTAISDTWKDVRKDKESKHPLEFVCQRLEKAIAEKPVLSQAREKALKNLMPGFTEGGRPPYRQELLTGKPSVALFLMKKLTVPDLARYLCDEEFQNQMDETGSYSIRAHLLVKSIVAVAEKETFGESIQSMYEKSLDEIVPRITAANKPLDKLLMPDEKTFWFLPELLKIFYKNLAKDAVLKKEVEHTAAVFGKDADKEDLDFSKI